MGFRVQLSSDKYSVEPGVAASVALQITNEGTASSTIELSVEGIDPEWVAIPVPVVEVAGGESHTERIFLKPPREPESLSGSYPFVIRAKSKNGDERTLTCNLEVKPFHNVSIDVQPRRGLISPIKPREVVLNATVMNLGNVEHTVKLFASDASELYSFEFDHEQVTIAAGAHKSVSITVSPNKRALIANARLQQLTVSARSLDERTVATATHAQIEERAFITPSVMAAIALLLAILTAFILLLPRKPVIDSFTVTPERVWVGDSFEVEWSSSNARNVELTVDGTVYSDLAPSGRKTILTDSLTDVDLTGRQIEVSVKATSGRRESTIKTRLVSLRVKEPEPEPEILEFSITPPGELRVGQVFQVTYKLSDSVTEAFLSPIGQQLDLRLEGVQFTAQVAGEFDYKLTARNQAGQEVERVIRLKIIEGSDASIVVFRADPALVDPLDGRVTLTWHVQNSSRTVLVENDGREEILTSDMGEIDKIVSFDTKFTLRVYDSRGRPAERVVTVKTYIPPSNFP